MSATGAALGTWIDGVGGDLVPVDDRGLQYGDGLFETILVRKGVPRFLEAHLARLARGCERLGLSLDAPAVRADIATAAAKSPALAIVKVIVTRGSATRRGYAPHRSIARRIVSLWPTADTGALAAGVALGIARTRVATNPAVAGLKHLNRLDNVLAAAEIAADEFDVLMLDSAERLVCGSACNVFAIRGRSLVTPGVGSAGVAGVLRSIVLREAPSLGFDVVENPMQLADLVAADGVFVTNARVGVVPVTRVREHSFRMTDIALQLRAHIEALDA